MRIAFTHNLKRRDDIEEAEFDTPETIAALSTWLNELGHEVEPVDVGGSPARLLAALEAIAPDFVFNTAEGTHGRFREAFYPALFEQLKIPYTGSGPYVCALTLDKHLTKMVVGAAGIQCPRGMLVRDATQFVLSDLRFPIFIKPNAEGSSKGITEQSLIVDPGDVMNRVQDMLRSFPDGVLIEEYIEGRDVAVGYLPAGVPERGGILPPVVYDLAGGANAFYDYDLKNHHSENVQVSVAENGQLSPQVMQRLERAAQLAFAALEINDIGRIDFRVTPEGDVYFLEVNALPSLEPGAGIYDAARTCGLAHPRRVLDAICQSALARNGLSARTKRTRKQTRIGLSYNLQRSPEENEAEFDSQDTIDALQQAIASFGHDVILLEATPEFPVAVSASGVDLVFNIAEGIRGRSREAQVPAILELLGTPYTGSDAATLCMTLDKGLAKRLVRDRGVRTPAFQVMRSAKARMAKELRFPLVVKPLSEGSSKGLDGSPVVHDEESLRARVAAILERYHQPALVENFLPGREFTIGLLGERRPRVLAPMEVVFVNPQVSHPTYAYEAKKVDQNLVDFVCPADVGNTLETQLKHAARTCWETLGCRDVARIDFRCDQDGVPNFIEANPLPGLSPGYSDLCLIAERSGLQYRDLVGEILSYGLRRARVGRKMESSHAS